jgi:hypothetical protein
MLVLEGKIWMSHIPSPDLFSIRHEKAVHHLENVSVVLITLWRNRWFIHYPYSDKHMC